MNSAGVRRDQRFTRSRPCPVCGGHDQAPRGEGTRCYGFLSEDGAWAHCTREDYAGGLEQHERTEAFAHKLTGECRCGVQHGPDDNVVVLEKSRSAKRRIATTYDYEDEAGQLLYQVVRYEPKDFRQRRPDGSDWIWKLEDVRRVLYRLPELLEVDKNVTVYNCEGEKDTDRARNEGLTATTNAQGAKKWRAEYAEALRERNVVILPHNDKPGREHAELVARSLSGKAASVKIVNLPGVPEDGGDLSDFFDAGGTAEELERLAEEATDWIGNRPVEASATIAGSEEPERFYNTDLGNSYRFVRHFGETVRYCYPWESWVIFDGKRWKPDTSGEIQRLGKEIPKEILREAADAPDDDTRKALATHALKTQSAARIRDMLALAKSDVPVQPEDFARDPYLFNVLNGTLDLRTGELRPHDRDDLITKLAPVDYDPEAEAPTWTAFLERVLPSESVREFLKRLAGYSLTGDVSEHVLPVLFGVGANGKSTAVNAMLEAVGEYGIQAAPDLLMAKRGGHPTEVADLFGCRLASVTEVEDGRRLNEALVKQITGGDRIRARRMRQDFWEFSPTHKVILSVNHKPEIRGTDTGIWRRIRLVPFTEVVPLAEQDTKLPEKLRRELPGILRWMVEGCLAWQREGLNAPDEVRKATGEYRADMDVVGAFLTECCGTGDEANVAASDLYNRYRTWCDDNGETPMKQRKFGAQLTERGYTRYRGGASGGHRWKGLTLCKSSICRDSDPTDVKSTINGSKNKPRITIGKTGSDGSDGSVKTSEPDDDLPNFGPSAHDRKLAERAAEAEWETEDL